MFSVANYRRRYSCTLAVRIVNVANKYCTKTWDQSTQQSLVMSHDEVGIALSPIVCSKVSNFLENKLYQAIFCVIGSVRVALFYSISSNAVSLL